MAFAEILKLKVRKQANFQCCICEAYFVEIHHIIPQKYGGQDTEENAAPLCPSCHDTYGANPEKRKFIREKRNHWYEICEKRYSIDSINTNELKIFIRQEINKSKNELLQEISSKQIEILKRKTSINFIDLFPYSILKAKLLIKQKKYKVAKEVLLSEMQISPKNSEVYYLLGYLFGDLKDYKNMIKNYEISLELGNRFFKKINNSKNYHWADGFNRGVQLFNRGAKADDTDSANTIFQKAVDTFNGAILCQPNSADTYKNLAYAYINMGDRDAAIEPYQKVVELSGEASAYVQLGDLHMQKGLGLKEAGDLKNALNSFNTAIEILEKGREKHPSDGDILLLLSNSYIAAGKLEVAKEAFQAGVKQEPENKFYRYNYGSLLLNAKEYEGAATHLSKALEIDPDYENALYNLAVTYVKWGGDMREKMETKEETSDEYKAKFEAALPLLEKYLTNKEEEGAVWDLLGKVYANLGMSDKSEEAFEKMDTLKHE